MVASSAGARTAPRFLRLSESWRRTQETAFKEITRSAPAEKRPHGDDGWGEFVRSPDPAAEKRRGRRLDCSSLSFLFHHEAAGGRPRREARAPCDVISQSAKERQHQVIGLELDIGRDREGDLRRNARERQGCAESGHPFDAITPERLGPEAATSCWTVTVTSAAQRHPCRDRNHGRALSLKLFSICPETRLPCATFALSGRLTWHIRLAGMTPMPLTWPADTTRSIRQGSTGG